MNIVIKSIPHDQHRYETVGDYWEDKNGVQHVRVTNMRDWRHEFLVALHELVELHLCKKDGIEESEIKAFDEQFEEEINAGLHGPDDEPGDDERAPYRKQHRFAENMERQMALALNVDWHEYNEAVMSCGG